MVELIITEKPSSAEKVAFALADSKPIKKKSKQSSYYELTHNNKHIIVTSAVGHLYGLVEKTKNGWTYPVFDITWAATSDGEESLKYVKDYIDTIQTLAKKANEFTIACDYDVEGEVIGLNVIRFACKQKDGNRMKFSTLTKPDLVEAYEHKLPHLDWGQAYAGETRHKLDWFYGINLSRALTSSVKTAGSFKVMSIGRVQGPALKILVDREKEIQAFKPEPFWQIHFLGEFKKSEIEAWHTKDKIFDKQEAERIFSAVKGSKEAIVTSVQRTQRQQLPPFPFDLTTLQTESYNLFKYSPKETLEIAQSLYLAGVTSYPRTSSQQLDPKLGFSKILNALSKQSAYEPLCKQVLASKELQPNNGKKTDPAHPAIYPTGVVPSTLKPREQKIYDLIVRRFLATFAKPAIRETMEVLLEVKKEPFVAKGTRTLEENWHVYYKPYLRVEEVTLPNLKENDSVSIKKIEKQDKETQPPNRYNPSSLIKELEKRNLGTKATRADILDRLFKRGYLEGTQITATKLGMETIRILGKYAPTIVDEKLTAHFEEDMDNIREGKEKQETVLEEAKHFLTTLLDDFRKKELAVGKDLLASVRETQDEQNYIGQCPSCSKGKLMIRFGKFGRFIACDQYPACSTTFKIPAKGMIKRAEKECESCKYPVVLLIAKRRKQQLCINPQCKTKVSDQDKKDIKAIEKQKIAKKCPTCGKDLVVRKSFYGSFVGCSGYPNCKYTENLDGSKGFKKSEKKEDNEKNKKPEETKEKRIEVHRVKKDNT